MKIALIGYGKMGKAIEEIALQKNHEIVLTVDEHNADTFQSELSKADVAIEFTRPEAAFNNILKCFDANIPVVCGTTGWMDKIEEAKKTCLQKNQTFFYASNYSIGVNIFFETNRLLAELMNTQPQYNVRMEEIHHIKKLDAPSGTAITLADDVLQRIKRLKRWKSHLIGNDREKNIGSSELPIYSSRIGDVPGVHEVSYSSADDTICIIHEAHNRQGFAKGAVLAAEWIINKKGVFGMKDLLNF